ncbi:MAG: EpsG family protein [Psychrobacillus psychrodurans]
MAIFWFTLFFATLITFLAEYSGRTMISIGSHGSQIPLKANKTLFIIVIIFLALISGFRSSIGDTGYYMYSYKFLNNNLSEVFLTNEFGFSFIQFILKKITTNPQFFLVITSLITISLIFITLYRYSKILSLSIFLFIASGIYISSMNGLRQFLVAAIIFFSISLIINNKKWKYIILILLLSTIHTSALVMIPVYFIVRQKAWSKRIFILITCSIILFLGFNSLFDYFSNIFQYTQYGNYIGTFGTETYSGANKIRIIVAAVPLILSFIYKNILMEKLSHYNIYVNFALLNFIIMLFASYNWIFARLGIYFDLYNLILLPAIIRYCFDKKQTILVGYLTIALYTIYFYYQVEPYTYTSYYLDIKRELIGALTSSLYK